MKTHRNIVLVMLVLALLGSVSAQQRRGRRDQGDSQGQRNERPAQGDRRGQRGRGQPGQRESGQFINRQIGLIKNTPQAWPGYTLFAPKHYLLT